MPEQPGTGEDAPPKVELLRLSRRAWIGLLAAAGVAWCVALLLWAHGADEALARWSAGLEPQGLLIGLVRTASGYGKPVMGVILLVGLVLSVVGRSSRRHRKVYLLTLMSLALSGMAGDLLKEVLERPRPALVYPDLSFAAGVSKTWSFPSGHSTKAVALALPFLLFVTGWRGGRGLVKGALAGLALSVCASRVVLGAHFLSDVVGGLATALSGLPLAVWASNAILGMMSPADLDRAGRIWIGVYAVLIPVLVMLS
jgi:undecaprenyl-diphosphatase